jgi:hypothetical protein
MHASLMTAQGREPLPEVQCCYNGFDENLAPSKVRCCRGESADISKHCDHTSVPYGVRTRLRHAAMSLWNPLC